MQSTTTQNPIRVQLDTFRDPRGVIGQILTIIPHTLWLIIGRPRSWAPPYYEKPSGHYCSRCKAAIRQSSLLGQAEVLHLGCHCLSLVADSRTIDLDNLFSQWGRFIAIQREVRNQEAGRKGVN